MTMKYNNEPKTRELKSYKGYAITRKYYPFTMNLYYAIEKNGWIKEVFCENVKEAHAYIDELEKNVQEEKAPEENVSRETLHETLQAQRFEAEREEYRGYEITMDETTYTYKARKPGSDRELVDETKTEIKKRIDDTLARDEELEAMKFGRITEEQVAKDRKRIAEGYGAVEYRGYILQCYDDETTFRNIGYVGEPLRGNYYEIKQRIDAYTRLSEEQNEASENVSRETRKGRYGIEIESINCTEETMTNERYRAVLPWNATCVGDYRIAFIDGRYVVMQGTKEVVSSMVFEEITYMMRYLYDCELIESNRAMHYRGHIIFKRCLDEKVYYEGMRKGDAVKSTGKYETIVEVMDEIDAQIDKIFEENGDDIERTYLPEYSKHGWKVYRWYVAYAGEYLYRGAFGSYIELRNKLDVLLQIVNNTFRGWLIEEYDEDDFTGYAAKPIGSQNYKIWADTIIEIKTRITTYIERGE